MSDNVCIICLFVFVCLCLLLFIVLFYNGYIFSFLHIFRKLVQEGHLPGGYVASLPLLH